MVRGPTARGPGRARTGHLPFARRTLFPMSYEPSRPRRRQRWRHGGTSRSRLNWSRLTRPWQRHRRRPRRDDDHAVRKPDAARGRQDRWSTDVVGRGRRRPRWPGSASSPVQLTRRSPHPPQPARVTAAPRPYFWDIQRLFNGTENGAHGRQESNPRQTALETVALPFELRPQVEYRTVTIAPGKARRRKGRLSRRREGGGGNRDGVSRFASSLPGSATSWLVACTGPRGSRPRASACRHDRKSQHVRPGLRGRRPATSSRSPFVRSPCGLLKQ